MEYKIVIDSNYLSLEKKVSELMKNVWIPQGGIAITNGSSIIQAMIRNK